MGYEVAYGCKARNYHVLPLSAFDGISLNIKAPAPRLQAGLMTVERITPLHEGPEGVQDCGGVGLPPIRERYERHNGTLEGRAESLRALVESEARKCTPDQDADGRPTRELEICFEPDGIVPDPGTPRAIRTDLLPPLGAPVPPSVRLVPRTLAALIPAPQTPHPLGNVLQGEIPPEMGGGKHGKR